MPASSPVHVRPAPAYLQARPRRVIPMDIVVVTVIDGGHLIEDLHKGMPLQEAIGLFALTLVLVSGIIILGMKYFLSKWEVVLRTDGNIDVLGARAKKIR